MVSIHKVYYPDEKNLKVLIDKQKIHGGTLIEYHTVFSFVFISISNYKVLLVPKQKSRIVQGLILSIPTLLLGWWSIHGLVWTLKAIVQNILGGVNLTNKYSNEKPTKEDLSTIEKEKKIHRWIFGGLLISISFIIFYYFLLAPIDL